MRRPTSGSPRDRIEVWQNREKGSDVNLASYLLRDVYRDIIDLAVVVTNDADLVPPIQFARDAGKEVIVCNPGRDTGRAIQQTGAQIFRLSPSLAAGAQFPRTLTDARRRQIQRPQEWR